jgi:signal transduction histidine kinase
MRWSYRTLLELAAILLMTAVVFLLAYLQYVWIGEVSLSEKQSLESGMATSVRNFSAEFSYDFERLCESLEIDPDTPPADMETLLQRQFVGWTRATSHPDLVAGLYIWRTEDPRGPVLESFDKSNDRFQPVSWPPALEPARKYLAQQSQRLSFVMPDRDAVYYPWTFYDPNAALIRPIFRFSPGNNDADLQIHPVGFLLVDLNDDFIRQQYLPDLVNHAFGASGLQAAVRTSGPPYQAIYLSNSDFPVATAAPDAALNLFDAVSEEAKRRGHPPLQPAADSRQWQLVVQHSTGSLDVAVAALRRKDLAISLGLLAMLAGSLVLVFSVARRSDRLSKLQMEFVAGVSHELCTPLAVINSAAENLADGVVDDPRQLQEYGAMIRDQGHRLERLVDEVLLFAAGRFGRSGYDLRPVEVGPIVAESLQVSESMLRDAGFTVEKEIGPDLPFVVADPTALGKCIENLVSNAMKYAGPSKWIAVRARLASNSRKPEVQIVVEDKGIGIPSADLHHIFEPFYRVQAVRDGQIRGVGLGLYLVKRMMEAMDGGVTASSEVGRGTLFTLHFPVAGPAALRQGANS